MCRGRLIATMSLLLLAFSDRTLTTQWVEMVLPRVPRFRLPSGSWEHLGPLAWADSLTSYVFEHNGMFCKTTEGETRGAGIPRTSRAYAASTCRDATSRRRSASTSHLRVEGSSKSPRPE